MYLKFIKLIRSKPSNFNANVWDGRSEEFLRLVGIVQYCFNVERDVVCLQLSEAVVRELALIWKIRIFTWIFQQVKENFNAPKQLFGILPCSRKHSEQIARVAAHLENKNLYLNFSTSEGKFQRTEAELWHPGVQPKAHHHLKHEGENEGFHLVELKSRVELEKFGSRTAPASGRQHYFEMKLSIL